MVHEVQEIVIFIGCSMISNIGFCWAKVGGGSSKRGLESWVQMVDLGAERDIDRGMGLAF